MVFFAILILGTLGVIAAIVQAPRALDPRVCSKCRYDLRGLKSGICPECGTPSPQPSTALPRRWASGNERVLTAAGVVLLGAGAAAAMAPWKANTSFTWFIAGLQWIPFIMEAAVILSMPHHVDRLGFRIVAAAGFVGGVAGLLPSTLAWDRDAQGGIALLFGWLLSCAVAGIAMGIATAFLRAIGNKPPKV